ncbi:MAG: DoxX family protein [Candidatus Woesearchaeota archaeon]
MASHDKLAHLQKYKEWTPTLLRIVVGVLFFIHGTSKLTGWDGWSGTITGTLGLPVLFAHLVIWVEILGGALLIIGLLTRYAAIALGFIMVVAIAAVKAPSGFMKGELDYTLLAILISLLITGPGKLALDAKKTSKKPAQAS